jgi:membrane-associated phospholipid phosphatase
VLFPPLPAYPVWPVITRLGEAQILLPAALALCAWLGRRAPARPLVAWWLGLLALAVLITTASKVAFLGWGVGSAWLDFTGVSGHAMFAAAIYPLLLGVEAAGRSAAWQRLAFGAGVSLALLVAVSRVMVGAHSVSEVVAGLAVGGAASAWALGQGHLPRLRVPVLLPVALAAWLALTPAHAPPSRTHTWVTRLSLAMSGRTEPYTRSDLRRAARPPDPGAGSLK